MVGYYVTCSICLFLLAMMPIWMARTDDPDYPIVVLILLAVIVFVVPFFLKRREREGAATPGKLALTVETLGHEREK
jgi:L-asparagine transporter-like permease